PATSGSCIIDYSRRLCYYINICGLSLLLSFQHFNVFKEKSERMRKVIVAFEVPNFSESAMRFIGQMNDAERVTVAGLFLPKSVFAALQTADIMTPGMFLPYIEEINIAELNECVKQFKQYCSDYHLRYDVLNNAVEFGLPELKQQSRYADLIVLG